MERIFIINPESGKRQSNHIGQVIKEVCESMNYDYKIYTTSKAGEATDIAKQFQDGRRVIYSVGGDGTNLEVLNGIVGTNNLLGIFPCGSGNDFYATIKDRKENIILSDIGQMNDTYFLNIGSVGIDAEIANKVLELRDSKIPVSLRYKYALANIWLNYEPIRLTKTTSTASTIRSYTLVAVCNGTQYGNGFKIAPHAKIDDGVFDVYSVCALNKIGILKAMPRLLKGKHESLKCLRKVYDKNVYIQSLIGKINCNLDGEIYKDNTFRFSLIPQGVEIYNGQDEVQQLIKKIKR